MSPPTIERARPAEPFPRDSEERYRAIVEAAAEGIVVGDNEGVFTFVNRRMAEMLGYAPEELIGRSGLDFVWPEERPRVLETRRALRRGEVIQGEVLFRRKGGAPLRTRFNATPLFDERGEHVANLALHTDVTEQESVKQELAERAAELEAARRRLSSDLDAMTRLHALSTQFVRAGDLPQALLEEILDAAIAITRADRGNLQLLDPASGRLAIAAQRGHEPWWLEHFAAAAEDTGASCGEALRQRERVVVEDVATSPVFAGTPSLEVQLRAGIRAVQSTPLVAASGELVGMISTHFGAPGRPDERDLRLLDLLARQAADMIARNWALRALRASEERFRRVVEQVTDGIFVASAEGRYTDVNPAACQLLGMTREELLACTFVDVLAPEEVPRLGGQIATLADGAVHRSEWRFRRRDGSTFVGELVGRRLPDGTFQGMVRDVTEQRQAEEAQRRLNEQLREADAHKNAFLAMLSHELRNPLAPIRNGVYVLDHAAAGFEQQARARGVIRRQVAHLTRLVDDLLDAVRISRGKVELHPERLDLHEAVERSMEDHRALFERAGVDLRLDHGPGPAWIEADPTRLAQVIGNVLGNALKFTPAGGEVSIHLATDGGRARLRIRDTGAGMEPGQEERMFEPFAQGDQGVARAQGGLGLGLSLVKALVELHGGAVSARSHGKGRGTEVAIELPLASPPAAPAGTSVADAGPPPRDVLLIEDNVDAAETLADVLRLFGHQVRVAHAGPDGLARARERRPDVVLCDIGLPSMDGFEVARAFRSDPGLGGVRLVALTGYAQPEDLQRAADAGFDVHLAKPLDLDALAQVLYGTPEAPGPAR